MGRDREREGEGEGERDRKRVGGRMRDREKERSRQNIESRINWCQYFRKWKKWNEDNTEIM